MQGAATPGGERPDAADRGAGLAVEALLERIVAWGERSPDVRAVLVLGSWARSDRPADAWSDLDLLVVCEAPSRYLDGAGWLEQLGPVWLTFREPTSVGNRWERRVLFDGGQDVDLVFLTAEELGMALGLPEVRAGLRRGVRVALDKDGSLPPLPAPEPAEVPTAGGSPGSGPPSDAEFRELVHDVLFHAVWTGKRLRRGELWRAKECLDGYLKARLLRAIQWQARVRRGWDHDVWWGGRFLEAWAEPEAVAGLRDAFARYDAPDVVRALWVTLDLFRRLAGEVAAALGYAYPEDEERRVRAWLEANLGPRPRSVRPA